PPPTHDSFPTRRSSDLDKRTPTHSHRLVVLHAHPVPTTPTRDCQRTKVGTQRTRQSKSCVHHQHGQRPRWRTSTVRHRDRKHAHQRYRDTQRKDALASKTQAHTIQITESTHAKYHTPQHATRNTFYGA